MTQEFQPIREQLINKLTERFSPEILEVIDDSHKHIGHAGHNGKGESHFKVIIVAAEFKDRSRIDCHRMVYAAVESLIPPVHALQINAKSN